MGTFVIECIICNNPFLWWSGNMDQRCPECKCKDESADDPDKEQDMYPFRRMR